MNTQFKKWIIFGTLFVLFAAPGFMAYLFYQHPDWLTAPKTNKGRLITPPVLAKSIFENTSKWHLVYIHPEECGEGCMQVLDKLARVRLALGRKWYDVESWLLTDNVPGISNALKYWLKANNVQTGTISSAKSLSQLVTDTHRHVFIADTQGYFILSYPDNFDPDAVYKDLKHLLNTPQHKSNS